jgi:hypothetical protein
VAQEKTDGETDIKSPAFPVDQDFSSPLESDYSKHTADHPKWNSLDAATS